MRNWITAAALVAAFATPALAQDARTAVAAASKAIGADGVTSVTLWGQGANYNLGQNNNSGGPWPRTNLDEYRRTIDFSQPALRATAMTYASPPQGTPAVQTAFNQVVGATAPWAGGSCSWASSSWRGATASPVGRKSAIRTRSFVSIWLESPPRRSRRTSRCPASRAARCAWPTSEGASCC